MVRTPPPTSRRDGWVAAAALLGLTGLAAWIPLAGGQPVEPILLVIWWSLAAVSMGSAAGLVLRKVWAKPLLGISTGIWLTLSGIAVIGVTRLLGVSKAASVVVNIG